MFWATASCGLILLIAALVLCFASRHLYAALASKRQLEIRLDQLKGLLSAADEATARLEAAIRRAEAPSASQHRDTLASIESLADPVALADANALTSAAVHLNAQARHPVADIFEQEKKFLAVARLQGQGLKPAEISNRLKLPIGEVEFLLSLRPVSQA